MDEKEEMKLWKERFNKTRTKILNKFFFLIISQVSLVSFLFFWAFDPDREGADGTFKDTPPSISVVISRFLCCFYLHVSQEDEVKTAFRMLKYSTNHPWKFEHWHMAFMANFVQIVVLMLVEILCIAILIL